MRIHHVLPVAALFVLATAACDKPKEDQTTATPATAIPPTRDNPGMTTTTTADLAVGKPAPDFTAKAHDGTDITLSKMKGKPVVLYFYPKDETSGCTKEAETYRDTFKELSSTGAIVIGISVDNVDSHKAFAKNHDLPFLLVSDESGSIAKEFGVPMSNGHLARQTFVIGADGNIKKIYRDVDPGKNPGEVLSDIKS